MPPNIATSLDTGKALELRLKGLSFSEIGRIGGLTKQAVEKRLAKFTRMLQHPEAVSAFRTHEAELLDAVRTDLITSLADDLRVKSGRHKLSGYQKVGMYGILFDKMRLLRNESTANVSNLTAIIQAAIGDGKRAPATASPSVSGVEDAVLVPQEEAATEPSKRID